jgi:glutathione S-transferase
MSSPVILYGDKFWVSPYVFSCFVTLMEKNVRFEVRELSLDGDQRRPDYVQKTLTGRVPALELDGFTLAESLAIVEYLEERFRSPEHASVLPADSTSRARCRQVLSWLRSDATAPLRAERPTASMFYGQPPKAPLTDKARASAARVVDFAERLLAAGTLTLFDRWSIADADLALTLQRLALHGDEIPVRLKNYAAAQWKRPSIAAWVTRDRAPFVPYS